MIYYYAFLALVMLFAIIFSKHPRYKVALFVTLAIMTLFAGLRDSSVGTDSISYANSFNDISTQLSGSLQKQLLNEPGFFYLKRLLLYISTDYWVLFMGIALLTYSCVLIAIKRETKNIIIPLFVYITLGLYTFVFNAARQGIAVAIYMLSFKYLFDDYKKGFIKYSFFVFLAAMFHKTVIITLPLYFLFKQKYSTKILVIIVLLGIGIGAILPRFLTFAGELDTRYLLYSTQASGGELLTVFYILITIYFIFQRKNINKEYLPKYDVCLNMMLFGTLIYVLVQLTGMYVEITRFAAYFQVAAIFIWEYIYQSDTKPCAMFSFAFIVGHLVYFYIFCTRMAALTPYIFNQNIL